MVGRFHVRTSFQFLELGSYHICPGTDLGTYHIFSILLQGLSNNLFFCSFFDSFFIKKNIIQDGSK